MMDSFFFLLDRIFLLLTILGIFVFFLMDSGMNFNLLDAGYFGVPVNYSWVSFWDVIKLLGSSLIFFRVLFLRFVKWDWSSVLGLIFSLLLGQDPSEFLTQGPVIYEVLQSGCWEQGSLPTLHEHRHYHLASSQVCFPWPQVVSSHMCQAILCWGWKDSLLQISRAPSLQLSPLWNSVLQMPAALVFLSALSVFSVQNVPQALPGFPLPCATAGHFLQAGSWVVRGLALFLISQGSLSLVAWWLLESWKLLSDILSILGFQACG